MESQAGDMAKALAELWDIQKDIQAQRQIGLPMGLKQKDGVEERLKELLERVRKFVEKFDPESYTVSVGLPWGANIGFTWSGKGKAGGRYWS